jgi:metal-sulfur cluster biosynthetic enzyme
MTLTAPGCPVAGDIVMEVDQKIRAIEEVSDVDVHLTFDPPWTKEMMTEEARLELGFL